MIGAAGWRRLVPALSLIAVCLSLAAVITLEWLNWQDSAIPPELPRAKTSTPSAPPNFTPPVLSTYAEVLSRHLFSPTRRPEEEAHAPEAVSTSMTLVAILISPRGPHALVRHGTPPQLDRVVEGQTIDGWTAEAIKFDRVVFRRGADSLELVPASTAPPASPATPPVRPVTSRTAG